MDGFDIDNLDLADLKKPEVTNNLPIPDPSYLKKPHNVEKNVDYKPIKYEKEFDLFCRWSALPKVLRKPPTANAFEKRYSLPNNYASFFKSREEYQNKRLTYFWEWMFDLYPDVVYATFKESQKKNMKAAQIFLDLIGKGLDINKPKVNVAPMVIMGISQEK
ncbi:MAG: hypothetical protein AABY22_06500, partial [Nanoarchaeota archaeon]